MAQATEDALLFKVLRKAEDVNTRAMALLSASPGVFDKVSHKTPKLQPSELGFIRTASWLFVLYFEAGRVNRQYLEGLLSVYGLDNGNHRRHSELIQAMRTYLQHNLNIEEAHDKDIISQCNSWFAANCGTVVPDVDEEWLQCLCGVLTESIDYLEALDSCLRNIEKDDSKITICEQWLFRRRRHHEPHQFDELITVVATDIGRDHLDAAAFRKRYYERWVSQLKLLSSDYEFAIEARKLIEDALLKDITSVLPITGADLLAEFELSPGPKVGLILVEAKRLYEATPCPRDSLIGKLRDFVNSMPP